MGLEITQSYKYGTQDRPRLTKGAWVRGGEGGKARIRQSSAPTSHRAQGAGPAAAQGGLETGAGGCTAAPPLRGSHWRPPPRRAQPARAPRARPPGTLPHRESKGNPDLREPSAVPHAQQHFLNAGKEIPACPSPDPSGL